MAEARSCPSCGASNPPDVRWCSQCFARFEEHPAASVAEARIAPRSDNSPQAGTSSQRATWTCSVCNEANPIDTSDCRICGTSMFESFGGGIGRPAIEPSRAVAWSVLPGVGMAKAGQGVLGVSAGLLILLALALGTVLLSSGAGAIGVALTMTGVALWGLTAHDAHRLASGDDEGTLLRPRLLTIVAGGVIGLMALAVVITSSQVGSGR